LPGRLAAARVACNRIEEHAMARTKMMSDIEGLSRMVPPLSRRGFMSTSAAAAAGYTLAAGPVCADPIVTDSTGLQTSDATVPVTGGAMPVYAARPAGVAKPPIILVCMEIFGLQAYIKDVARRLAKLGALAVAPDYYFRMGDLTKVAEMGKLMPLVNGKADTELFADLDATLAFAEAQGGDPARVGIIGFCRGGRSVWLYSTHNPHLKAGVAFYGSLMDPHSAAMPQNAFDLAGEVKEPVLGLYGAEDPGITPDQVEKMKEKLRAAGKTAEFHIYPGAAHAFHADYRASYRKEAAEQGWAEMQRWFKTYGVLS
jgi:carboxymethylenebutenolidase